MAIDPEWAEREIDRRADAFERANPDHPLVRFEQWLERQDPRVSLTIRWVLLPLALTYMCLNMPRTR